MPVCLYLLKKYKSWWRKLQLLRTGIPNKANTCAEINSEPRNFLERAETDHYEANLIGIKVSWRR